MFRGVQYINMDAKGRVAVPARHREPLMAASDGKIVVTIDTRGSDCLVIYPLPEWERIQRDVEALPGLKLSVQRFQRLILAHATDLELDNSGRILLPQPLRDHARLEKKLVLAGLGNKLDLWSEDLWHAERERALQESIDSDDLPEELLTLKL
ncbi:MAG: division/cell wall cluster transcriptional repressor MraZ [Halioglobus sp.]|nr:division/cell wall cluster transcriptional repressor MraZ [Halioglobus sp.]